MNKSNVSTREKVSIPLRLDPDTYKALMQRVWQEKDKTRGYSANQLLTELLEKELKISKKKRSPLSFDDNF